MKIFDKTYHCKIPGQVFGVWYLRCHLRIFRSHDGVQTVMVTDLGLEIGWFNPCVVEALATQIVAEFQLDPSRLVWLEGYAHVPYRSDCGDFNQVTFDWHNEQATNPRWTTIAPEATHALICEALLSA